MQRRVFFQLLPIISALLFGLSCSNKETASRGRPPPIVTVQRAQRRDVSVEIHAPVDLRPIEQAEVGAKTLGYLDAVFVDRGDLVKKGQLVALVRPSDLPDQLSAARSALAQAQAAVALARANHERAKELAPNGIVSRQDLQQAATALASAEAAEAAANAQAGALGTRLGEMRITSPLNGVVVQRRLDPGALVGPPSGGAILSIARVDVLRVFIAVNERSATGVSVGKDAHVELDALPGRSFHGRVVRLAPAFDPTTRTLDAEVHLINDSGLLRPGMYGRGSIVVEVHPQAFVVSGAALQVSAGQKFIYLANGDQVQRRPVEVGVDEGEWVEVTKGLSNGDEFVTAGADGLSDGVVVRVVRDVDPFTGAKLADDAAGASKSPATSQD
jgi:membrane fusion protein, multidrug efflux system